MATVTLMILFGTTLQRSKRNVLRRLGYDWAFYFYLAHSAIDFLLFSGLFSPSIPKLAHNFPLPSPFLPHIIDSM
jgi:hypothetical protein